MVRAMMQTALGTLYSLPGDPVWSISQTTQRILTWPGSVHEHEGGFPRARLIHRASDALTPATSSNLGNSTAWFVVMGDCVRTPASPPPKKKHRITKRKKRKKQTEATSYAVWLSLFFFLSFPFLIPIWIVEGIHMLTVNTPKCDSYLQFLKLNWQNGEQEGRRKKERICCVQKWFISLHSHR